MYILIAVIEPREHKRKLSKDGEPQNNILVVEQTSSFTWSKLALMLDVKMRGGAFYLYFMLLTF